VSVLPSAADALIIVDDQDRVIDATRLACDLTGYTREDLLSRSLHDLSSTSETMEASRLLEKLQEEAVIAFEARLRVKDGSVQPFHLRISRLSVAGRRHAVVRVARRRRAADRLAEDPDVTRTLLDTTTTLLLVLDDQGRIAYANRAFEARTGFLFRDIRGTRVWDLLNGSLAGERLRAAFLELGRVAFPPRIEQDWTTKTGEIFRLVWSTNLLFRADGRVRYVIASGLERGVDSERGAGEVRRLNEGLERRVEERTAQLERAIREMASFSYTIAHDLRAPLRSMSGFAQAMVDDYGASMDPTCLDFARRVAASARKMDALIVDLLSYSRLIHLDVRVETVNLESLVRTVLYRMSPELNAAGAMVEVQWPIPKVQGNAAMLDHVIVNLLSNAIKFVAPGVPPRVTIRPERRNGRVCLWVEDNGIGIAPEFHERIFGIFQRLNREEEYPGTGIGLAIVRKALERMGGSAGVESLTGRGSRFWINLEAAEPAP
jgi:PAS domain S-box-containing protein